MVDAFARRLGGVTWRTKDGAAQALVADRDVVLVKPQTYMNDSGTPLARIAAWYKTPAEQILVVSDDLDLPFGRLRMRASGGHGGQNGLRSIVERFGEGFPRLRVGIGRGRDAIDHVLAPFGPSEAEQLDAIVATACDGIERWLAGDVAGAVHLVNSWSSETV